MRSWSRKTTEAMNLGIRPKWVNWAFPTLVAASFLTATDCLWVKASYCNLLAGRMIDFPSYAWKSVFKAIPSITESLALSSMVSRLAWC